MGYVIGVLYVYLWFSSIIGGYLFFYCPILPIVLVSNKLYRYSTDIIFTFWQQYPTVLLKILCKTDVHVTGDSIKSNEMSVLVINHRTRTDWNFIWPLLYNCTEGKYRFMFSTKMVLKDIIRHIPGPGWVIQLTSWIFVRRQWLKDKETLQNFCDYMVRISYKSSILIFPEGTDFTEETKNKSDDYARSRNLQEYDYILHPRTSGFAYLTSHLLKENCLDAVYDLTILYPDVIPQTEISLVQGRFPKKVEVHIIRYPSSIISKSEDDLKVFLRTLWVEKERALQDYFTNQNSFGGRKLERSYLELFPALIFWTILPYFSFYLWIYNGTFRTISLLHTMFLLGINFWTPGFQWFEINLYSLKVKYLGSKFAF